MKDGRRFSRPPDPYTPPATPQGQINLTDPDSHVVKGSRGRGFLQGYNAQAVANEHQIVIAAEVMTVAPDFGHLEPMLDAAQRELDAAGVTEVPQVLVADAGYWHQQQMERIVDRGIPVLIPPDAKSRKGTRPGWTAAFTRSCAESSPATAAASSTASAKRSSSRSLPTRSSTAASTASDDEAEPPSAPNGASSQPHTTC